MTCGIKLASQELHMNNSRQKWKVLFYTISKGSSQENLRENKAHISSGARKNFISQNHLLNTF